MGRGKSLNDQEKGKIKAYKDMNLSNKEIARRIHRSSNLIDNYVKDMELKNCLDVQKS